MVCIRIPAHTYAVASHQGPTSGPDRYAELTEWAKQHDYETVSGTLGIEVYPADGSRPGEKLRFDIYLPVRPHELKAATGVTPVGEEAKPPSQEPNQASASTRFKDGSVFENCQAEGVAFRDVALPGLSFENANLGRIRFESVNLSQGQIHDANLSDLEIKGAQLGGALFRHIGLPPPGHPAFKEGVEQRPLRFEECDLHGSTVKDCDLSHVAISGCRMPGMTIDGIAVEDLLATYRDKRGERKPAAERPGPAPRTSSAATSAKGRVR